MVCSLICTRDGVECIGGKMMGGWGRRTEGETETARGIGCREGVN